jgi:hypothetical protein
MNALSKNGDATRCLSLTPSAAEISDFVMGAQCAVNRVITNSTHIARLSE